MAWSHIAPMMAQASILHAWAEALGQGVQTAIRRHPLPDLEDPMALDKFADATHRHFIPNRERSKSGFAVAKVFPCHTRQPLPIFG